MELQDKFFQQLWELKVHQDEVEVHAMKKRIETLEQELTGTKEQNADMLDQIQQIQSQKVTLEARLCDMSEKLKTGKRTGPEAEAAESLLRTFRDHINADLRGQGRELSRFFALAASGRVHPTHC